MAAYSESVQGDEVAKPEGQVLEQINEAEKWLAELSGVIGALDNKLEPVLDRSSAEMVEKDPRPEQVLVPLANAIRSLRREVESQTERLRWILRSVSI